MHGLVTKNTQALSLFPLGTPQTTGNDTSIFSDVLSWMMVTCGFEHINHSAQLGPVCI